MKSQDNYRMPTSKLSDRVYEYILNQIIAGAFPVNSRLPTELELGQRLSVSRPVVRDALQRLREEGLLASRQGSGSIVVRRPGGAIAGFAPISSISDIQRCYMFRYALEGEAAAIAARHCDSALIEKLGDALAAMELAAKERRVAAEEDFAFHFTVAEATGNYFFAATLTAIREQIATGIHINRSLSLIQPRERLVVVQKEHESIYKAIASGADVKAREAMHIHIENARRRVFEGG